jgi:ubiquinone/menaquinone biosynthesis C-methylase UbiE
MSRQLSPAEPLNDTHTLPPDTRAAWDAIAPGYDRTNTPTQMWLGEQGLRRAGLRAGMHFLDVAAGSGALSLPAARLGAQVLATDQSPVMLELLAQRARREPLAIETQVMDGHALDLEADRFDLAGSQFGVMLFPDMPRGLREMVRVVKPGGRVLVTAYGDPHHIEFLGFLVSALQAVRPGFEGPPMDPVPLPFQLQDPGRLRQALAAAGLAEVEVVTLTETTEFASGQALWDWLVWSNPIVEQVLGSLSLTPDERTVTVRALDQLVRERAAGAGAAKLTDPVNIGVGTKPAG